MWHRCRLRQFRISPNWAGVSLSWLLGLFGCLTVVDSSFGQSPGNPAMRNAVVQPVGVASGPTIVSLNDQRLVPIVDSRVPTHGFPLSSQSAAIAELRLKLDALERQIAADQDPTQPTPAKDDTAVKPQDASDKASDGKSSNSKKDEKKSEAKSGEEKEKAKDTYYVEPLSVGTKRESEPPKYVRNLSKIADGRWQDQKWLDVGLDYRLRYELRNDDFRRPVEGIDEPFLLRTRAFVGIKEIMDPFRMIVEYEDAARDNSDFPLDNRDVNRNEFIQGYGELFFDDFFGGDQPFRIQAGRFALEYVDRRLIARNEWRNTTNNFQGFRAILGQEKAKWQLDLLAFRPMERLLAQPDRVDENRMFWGAIANIRHWSEVVTFQPYYLILQQDPTARQIEREIHTMGLRGYGIVGETGWDYDAQVVAQFGNNGDQKQQAWGGTYELGYTYCHPWNIRSAAFIGYASGDRSPTDLTNERFDRLFGFARPWSANDYFLWENLITPKLRVDLEPIKDVKIDAGYGVFWLASATDSWATANLRDPTGNSGSFLGHEFDVRLRLKPLPRMDLTLGYAHFTPGRFTQLTSRNEDSDFFYVESSWRLFK